MSISEFLKRKQMRKTTFIINYLNFSSFIDDTTTFQLQTKSSPHHTHTRTQSDNSHSINRLDRRICLLRPSGAVAKSTNHHISLATN